MNEMQLSKDSEFMAEIVGKICNYAVDNDMEPDETIQTVADNLMFLTAYCTFNFWGKKDSQKPKESDKMIGFDEIKELVDFARNKK